MATETVQITTLSDALAVERTFLAWIRTGLALMGFGFVVARFGLFLQQVQFIQHIAPVGRPGLSLWFGTALIVAGVLINILSARSTLRLLGRLGQSAAIATSSLVQGIVVALFLAAVGIAMAIYLVLPR